MPNTIRLSKVLKELNISIDAACNYLENNNIPIDKNPNAKISEEVYRILVANIDEIKSFHSSSEKIELKKLKYNSDNKKDLEDFIVNSRNAWNSVFSDSLYHSVSKFLWADNINYITPKVKNTLAFNNFRRFPHFKETEFSDITFLVGQNNSGKSTFVKAYMLIKSFLASGNISSLNFSYTGVEDLNIVTYSRAKCKSINAPEENAIDFTLNEDGLEYYIKITANDKDVDAQVFNFNIKDPKSGITLKFLRGILTIEFDSKNGENYKDLQKRAKALEDELKIIKNSRSNVKNPLSTDYINFNSRIKNTEASLKGVKELLKETSDIKSLFCYLDSTDFETNLSDCIQDLVDDYFTQKKLIQIEKFDKETLENYEALQVFYQNKAVLEDLKNRIVSNSNNIKFKYLPASLNKQSSLFAIRDVHNPLAQVIHEFMQLKIYNSKDDADKFVKKWIQEDQLQIGEKLKIKLLEGEAYNFLIYSNKVDVPLADKGMGSIQAMLLILRIATIIHKQQRNGDQYTLIIEEPELNLHPALQSKLCEMFYDAYTNYGIKFIIETHSEYIIRRSQLFVKELKNFDSNPFATIYFDKDITKEEFVWNMKYREDGKFANEFGSGFFDESTNLAFDLF